jgi:hypothetical protein
MAGHGIDDPAFLADGKLAEETAQSEPLSTANSLLSKEDKIQGTSGGEEGI